jgi:hypothetical protein
MSERETTPADLHPEATLLPWYVTGKIADQDRLQVEQHLVACQSCREELDAEVALRQSLMNAYSSETGPSPQLARSVFAQVSAEALARRRPLAVSSSSWIEQVDQWIRGLLIVEWVPTLATLLLVGQVGIIMWLAQASQEVNQVTTRSLGSPTVSFRILFQEQATEAQIRTLLSSVHGRIVNGPDPGQRYVVEIIAGDPAVVSRALERFRARPEVIQHVEVGGP